MSSLFGDPSLKYFWRFIKIANRTNTLIEALSWNGEERFDKAGMKGAVHSEFKNRFGGKEWPNEELEVRVFG